MLHLIRLGVIALIGYIVYDIISSLSNRKRQPVANFAPPPDAGGPMISGSSHQGKTENVHDSDGAGRRRTVGRGVIR